MHNKCINYIANEQEDVYVDFKLETESTHARIYGFNVNSNIDEWTYLITNIILRQSCF